MKNSTKLFFLTLCFSTAFMSVNAHRNDLSTVTTARFSYDPSDACYASKVIAFAQEKDSNGQPVSAERSHADRALGQPDMTNARGGFVSLGINGYLVLEFAGAIFDQPGNDIMVYESSYSGDVCGKSDDEKAHIELSQDGVTWVYYGEICRNGAIDFSGLGLEYVTQIKITDSTTKGGDGYDVDGVVAINGCQELTYAGCYASELLEYVEGTTRNGGIIDAIRTSTPENVLGQPEGTDDYVFASLGYGGSITLGFGGMVKNGEGADLVFIETSFGNTIGCETYREYADVYVSLDGDTWHFANTICKSNNKIDISDAGDFQYIKYVKVVNNDDLTKTHDAYDLDGVIAIHTCDDYIDDPTMGINDMSRQSFELKTYPNPTAGISNIEFRAPQNGKMRIEVYDIMGRNITTVFDQEVNAFQNYKANFNGSSLPNGMYIYKITLGNMSSNKKFMIAH